MKTHPQIKLSCIIDDDIIYVNLVKKIIRNKNLSEKLIIFRNGEEALMYFKSNLNNFPTTSFPEIVLLDLNMPVMDGWEFLKKFRKLKNNNDFSTSLFVVSSSIDPYEINKAKSDSIVTDYLIKPVKMDAFEKLFRIAASS